MRGSLANLVIYQDVDQDFTATLYVEPTEDADHDNFESTLQNALESLGSKYAGLSTEKTDLGWLINVPSEHVETHEEHFTRVTERYLDMLIDGSLQEWERTNLETKYYVTTQAYLKSH